MKSLYIVNMKEGNAGGLFKATYERIIRHNMNGTGFIKNINYYDSKTIVFLKEHFLKKETLKYSRESYTYDSLLVSNLNFKRGLKYYFNRVFNFEKNNLNSILNSFIKKNINEIVEADLIHAHWGYPNGYIAYELSKKYSIPYFLTFHGSEINNAKEKEVLFLLEAMENAEKCFFVSKQLLINAKALGYSGKNAAITYNGVDIDRFKIPDKSLQQNKKVGYIGALKPIKGADLLPYIYQEIARKSEEHVDFVIVGDGPLKEEIQTKVEASNLPVQLTGQIDFEEVPKILEGIDVLVVPSRNEGLGMVILEANAMGIPVVGTNVGGIPEAIGYKENLIEPNEDMIENMAQRVRAILENDREDPNKYRKRVEDHFLWEDIIEIEREYYLNALKK